MSLNPNIQVSYAGVSFLANETRGVGTFVQNTTPSLTITISNTGDANSLLIINEISVVGDGFKGGLESGLPVDTSSNIITLNKSVNPSTTFKVNLNTANLGNKSVTVQILSNDVNVTFILTFLVVAASVTNQEIVIIYDGLQVPNLETVNVGEIPLAGISDVSFIISNYGIPNLTVNSNGITVTSSGSLVTIVNNPVSSSSAVLGFNVFASFSIRLDASSLGDKTAIISVASDDPNTNPYTITVGYTVSKAFDLVISQNLSDISNNENVNIGSFEKGTSITKSIFITNAGIFYNIRILSISNSGDVIFNNIPSLPFILQPKEVNSLQFNAVFNSSTLGSKSGSFKVNWEVFA